jgi:flagellar biosynthesis protein FlhG
MSKLVADQADGLRRLLAHTPTRIIAVAGMGPGGGASQAAMNLGAALVQQGKDVLVLDEHGGTPAAICAAWAIDPLGDLADVADRRLSSEGAIARAGCGVGVLPAPLGDRHAEIDPRVLCRGGVGLIAARIDDEGRLSTLARAADELLLVLQPNAASITSAYAGIKRLHYAHGLKQLRFLVDGVAGAEEAHRITTNLASTGSRYLAVSLEAAGWVRADPHLADARRLRQSVVEAFPASAAAVDFRRVAVDMGGWPWRSADSAARPARAMAPTSRGPRVELAPGRAMASASSAIA